MYRGVCKCNNICMLIKYYMYSTCTCIEKFVKVHSTCVCATNSR